jgi:hypothetical protein
MVEEQKINSAPLSTKLTFYGRAASVFVGMNTPSYATEPRQLHQHNLNP